MKVWRYFCDFEEIKLLKIVNGIYGLFVNCILFFKIEVEKYCLIYIDKFSELNLMRVGDVYLELFGRESDWRENGCKDRECIEMIY